VSTNEPTVRLETDPGVSLFVYAWSPASAPKGIVLISHGMAEHAARYARFAQRLCGAGYAVYAADHRGHGKSVAGPGDLGYFGDGAGFEGVIADQERLRIRALQDHPSLPVFVFAHSMGSFVIRRFLIEHGHKVAGAVIRSSPACSRLLGDGSAARRRASKPASFVSAMGVAQSAGCSRRHTNTAAASRDTCFSNSHQSCEGM